MNSGPLTVVLDASLTGPYTEMPLAEGMSTWDLMGNAVRALAETGARILVYAGNPPDSFPGERLPASEPGMGELIRALNERRDEFGEDGRILYHGAHMPFLDMELVARLRSVHEDYIAQFTFADGYPAGIAPQILSTEILGPLAHLMRDMNPKTDDEGLFAAIQRDVNAFDVETELAPQDYRMLRVRFTTDTRRDYLLCRRAAEALSLTPVPDAAEICRFVDQQPQQLRTLPAWIELDCGVPDVQDPVYRPTEAIRSQISSISPDALSTGPLEPAKALDCLRPIMEFAGEASVSVSAFGEIGLHPDPLGLMGALLEIPGLDLFVETSGVGWCADSLSAIPAFSARAGSRLSWIVFLDTDVAADYTRVRGKGYAEAMAFVSMLEEACPDRTWVQVTRTPELEDGLESLYRRWKDRPSTLVVQKHDSYAGLIPDRKVADLSPAERFPCWHAKRDLVVLADGTVLPCRSGLGRLPALGQTGDGAQSLWEAGDALYRQHLRGDLPAVCAACDEYYTYNA